MFMMLNPMHDGDREKPTSVVKNLSIPKTKEFSTNPLFNKMIKLEKNINLNIADLEALG